MFDENAKKEKIDQRKIVGNVENLWNSGEIEGIERFLTQNGYRLQEQIGAGGFGEVYRVEDEKGQNFAVKIADVPSGKIRFLEREAKLLWDLRYPVFPKYKAFYKSEEKGYLIMEYLEGNTLKKFLNAGRSFTEEQIRSYATTMAQSLSFLHRRGYVFRDLKPANMIIDPMGNLRILDLGCVLHVREGENSKVGSAPFAAPEQLESGICDPLCDLYSLGRIMEQLINRSITPRSKSNLTPRSKQIHFLSKMAKWCREEEPGKRFPDAEQLSYILQDCSVKPRFVICQNIWKNTCRFEQK